MEKITHHALCPIYLSGDHNPPGIQSLIDLLPHYPRRHLYLLVGMGRDKNLDGILRPLFALENASVFLTQSPFQGRALTAEPGGYGDWLARAKGASASPEIALAKIRDLATAEDLIVVTGSLYLVGFFKNLFGRGTEGAIE